MVHWRDEAARALEDDLRRAAAGEVAFDTATRAVYACDASNFRQPPIGVVIPQHVEDVAAVHRVCHAHGAPIVARGCGTGLAGAAVNRAVVLDCSRHLTAVGAVDLALRQVTAQSGAINDAVNAAAASHGLRFGPDPATHAYCTIGGNIATNACGVHSLQARFDGDGSRTSDNLAAMEVLTYDGLRLRVGPTSDAEFEAIVAAGGRRGQIYRDLRALARRYEPLIRQRFPAIPRRVSGYNLDDLLAERGCNVAAALAGSEGTCVTILEATLKLIPRPPAHSLLVLGYAGIAEVATHIGEILAARPAGCETFDIALFPDREAVRDAGLPAGAAWVLVELGGEDAAEARSRAQALARRLQAHARPPTGVLLAGPEQERRVWRVRETGLARSSRQAGHEYWPGWEDSAVAPEQVGDYLVSLQALYTRHGLHGSFFGHLGDGCIHTRIDFDLSSAGGVRAYRAFLEEAADLVAAFGGSLSGEHGDGQQRGELLERMYGPELLRAFREFKAIWDPTGAMNPGKVVDPYPLDDDLRLAGMPRTRLPVLFAYPQDGGSFATAALRCVGVGACRRPEPAGVMCPSFEVTRQEQHSTRGRARLLAEMLRGDLVTDGWASPEVRDALDLCLACKGCTRECPAGVDLPTYKAEFLHHHYQGHHRGRRRPRRAYAFGFVDQALRVATRMPALARLALGRAPVARALQAAAGMATERAIPMPAPLTLQRWFHHRRVVNPDGPRMILWPDTFVNAIDTAVGVAAVEAIEAAGWRVLMPTGHVCCGRPLYDFGFLPQARRYLQGCLAALAPLLEPGIPVVGLEPSCVATFRHELPAMLADDATALALSRQVLHFSEFVTRYQLATPGTLVGRHRLWTHCHQRATGGADSDLQVLQSLGAEVHELAGSCCGLAGSWGYDPAHYDLSMALGARSVLAPAGADQGPPEPLVANGFSCRSQIRHGGGTSIHLAQALRLAATGTMPPQPRPSVVRRALHLAAGAALCAGLVALARSARRRARSI